MRTYGFWELIDETSDVWYLIDRTKYPHLFPDNVAALSEDMKDNIREHFYNRQIGFSSPQDFMRHFHRLIKERANTWARLIATETALRSDDMIYNYDMEEHATDEREGSNTSSTTHTPNLTIASTSSDTSTSKRMDTPDAITSDIDSYMSEAGKDTSSTTSSQSQTGTDTTTGTGGYSDGTERTLTRKGNIGVMTAAQILGGYREAQMWDAYSAVIFPEINMLMLNSIDLEEVDMW